MNLLQHRQFTFIVISAFLIGCPEADDDIASDDDTNDDDTGDDDIADFDPPDCNPAEGSGTLTFTGIGPNWDTVGSAVWNILGFVISTEAHCCDTWSEYGDYVVAVTESYAEAAWAAKEAQDGVAACEANLVYYKGYEALYGFMQPEGACTLRMFPASPEHGDWEAPTDDLTSLSCTENYWVNDAIAALGDCSTIGDYEEFTEREEASIAAFEGAVVYFLTSGTMTVTVEGQDRRIVINESEIWDADTKEQGTMSIDVLVRNCDPK